MNETITYEQAESQYYQLRRDTNAGIRNTMREKGYGLGQPLTSHGLLVLADRDWEHILWRRPDTEWSHIDHADMSTLLEIWRAVLRCIPNIPND